MTDHVDDPRVLFDSPSPEDLRQELNTLSATLLTRIRELMAHQSVPDSFKKELLKALQEY